MARSEDSKRITVTVDDKLYQQLDYWAEKKHISVNQYLKEALESAIAYENQDYPLPTLEQARLNQLIDRIGALESNFKSLESVITSGFDSLLGLTRGDNYLLERDDGEI